MRNLPFAVRMLMRDARSGELTILALAVIVAVAALTAVGFFTDRVNQAVKAQAAEVLAADLRLQSSRPIGTQYFEEAARRGLRGVRTLSTLSVVFHGERSQLTSLRMVEAGYPLRGKVRIAARPFAAAEATDEVPARGAAWADSRLLAQLGAGVGARINVGAAQFTITRVLDYRPDQGSGFSELTPSLMMNLGDEAATQLLRPGSRATYAALFAGRAADIAGFKAYLESHKGAGERLQDVAEASPQIQSSSDRAGRFLNLSALASVLLAIVAVAMAARHYVRRHFDTVALMKCLGTAQRDILSITVYEMILLALACAAVGTAVGFGAQAGLAWLLEDFIRGELPPPSAQPIYLGLVTAVAVLVGFALPSLLQLRRVPPLRVLRRNLQPPPVRYAVASALAIGAVMALLLWIVRDWRLVLGVALATAATVVTLMLAALVLVKSLASLRGTVGVAWRYGLANIARRGRESVFQIVAFGLGLMVLLLLAVVRNDLLATWRSSLPADMPNFFFINIAAAERAPFQQFFDDRNLGRPDLFPMTRARLTHIDGRPVDQLKFRTDRGRGFAEREQNLSWSEHLQSGNRIVAGRWWTAQERGRPLVSVATEYRDELDLKLGDRLTFDVAGETIEVTIASFREVAWDRFTPNFFLVLPPGVLEQAAGTYMTSLHLEPQRRAVLGEVVGQFPAVSIFDVDALLRQVREVMDKAARAVQYVFLFTLLAGVTVLLAAVQSTREERRYESAILRTLGASRRTVLQGIAAEFLALGALAGTLAAMGATAAGYFVARRLFDLRYDFDPAVWLLGLAGGTLLVGASGWLATRAVIDQPPATTLRQAG